MKLEAMKHQGRTSDQVGQKLTSVQALADSSSDSKTQVQRYIRLIYLEKPLLDLVDEGRIALTPAVEIYGWIFQNKSTAKSSPLS